MAAGDAADVDRDRRIVDHPKGLFTSLTSPHLIRSRLSRPRSDWSQSRRIGSRAVKRPSSPRCRHPYRAHPRFRWTGVGWDGMGWAMWTVLKMVVRTGSRRSIILLAQLRGHSIVVRSHFQRRCSVMSAFCTPATNAGALSRAAVRPSVCPMPIAQKRCVLHPCLLWITNRKPTMKSNPPASAESDVAKTSLTPKSYITNSYTYLQSVKISESNLSLCLQYYVYVFNYVFIYVKNKGRAMVITHKTRQLFFYHSLGQCRPIFPKKILADSQWNFICTCDMMTSNCVLLHYFVKFKKIYIAKILLIPSNFIKT